jgi:hypothetical protein
MNLSCMPHPQIPSHLNVVTTHITLTSNYGIQNIYFSIQLNEITKFASQMCYGPIALSNMIYQHECVMYHRTLVASTLIIFLIFFLNKKISKKIICELFHLDMESSKFSSHWIDMC